MTTGVRLVTATGEALGLIQNQVTRINSHGHSIATAAKEQTTGLSEVSTAVNQMDQVTQQNAAMLEETTASTGRLADEVVNLCHLISRFKLRPDGPPATSGVREAAASSASPARALHQRLTMATGSKAS